MHSLLFSRFHCFVFFCLLLLTPMSYGKSSVYQATLYKKNQTLFVNVNTSIDFPKNVSEAILNGMRLNFKYEFEIHKKKWYKPIAVAKVIKTYHLSYHRVTNTFTVSNPVTLKRDEFNTLYEAKQFMQTLNAFPLILTSELPKEASILKIRFHMSNANLPAYIRVDRIFNKNWDVDSDWSEWRIPRSI